MAAKSKSRSIITTLLKRWFIDSLGAMALGLFASLIVGVIISDLIAKIPGMGFLMDFLTVSGGSLKGVYLLGASSPVIGSAIGVAIAYGPVSYTHLDVYKRQPERPRPLFSA